MSGDRVERGPGNWRLYRRDARLARRRLGSNAFRFSIEWSRLFPRSTVGARTPRQLEGLANKAAVRHYAAELRSLRRLGLEPVVTLHHFTTPSWLHDPLAVRAAFAGVGPDDPPPNVTRGGWLNQRTVTEFGKFAAWAAWKFGKVVDLWVTVNEPMVVAVNGYVNIPGTFAAWFPPGVFSFSGAIAVVRNLAKANAVAYDAVHRFDRRARVGPVHNMIAFTPADPVSPADRAGADHADYIFNRLYLDAVVKGIDDRDVDGVVDPGERRADLRGRADFIGLNYYFRSRVTGLGAPASTSVPLFDFLHRVRLGDLSQGLPAGPAHGRQLPPARVRNRERARRRRRRPARRLPGLPSARAARRDASGRGQGEGLLCVVAHRQLRVGGRLLPALRLLLLQRRDACPPRAAERACVQAHRTHRRTAALTRAPRPRTCRTRRARRARGPR